MYPEQGPKGGTPARPGSWLAGRVRRRLGGALQLPEGVTHRFLQLAVPVRGHVDDPSPGGQPPHLVGLGDQGAVVDGGELVAPHGRLAATLLGDEGELPARVGGEDPAVTRPAEPFERTTPVVAHEPCALRRPCGATLP